MQMKTSKTNMIGTIITAVILIAVVVLSNIGTTQMSTAGNVISKVFMPIQNGVVYLKNKITKNDSAISDIDALKSENAKLKEENSKLTEQVRELEIIKAENDSLNDYMNLKNKYTNYDTVPASIVEKSISNYDKVFIINVGKNDGIVENLPVIGSEGLVGHVIEVTDKTAKVQTIIDTASTVSSSLTTSQETILLKGELGSETQFRGTYIPTDSTIIQGDTLVTSGLGGIYPRGIMIGTVSQLINTKNLTDRYALVDTAVNFNTISSVLVITGVNL